MGKGGADKRPIIIRKKKVVAGEHHGGAWKVAYADFVTALMAFFLVMWLVASANDQQKTAI
ncbi:MAG: flagellar motor protein MotB, partial [Gammaproteobacteria bacterium]|nr:flagellar motor protein MotB [Gammaproteobacteria bacterium]